jgi:gamma-glutamylputrescine oxidase
VPEGTDANVARVLDLVDRFGIDCDLERAPVAQLDPYRYAAGLKQAAAGLGAVIHEGTRVASIVPGRPVRIVGDRFALEAPRLAVATNGYTPKLGIAADRIFPVHTAAAVTGPLPAEVLAEIPDSIFVSTSQEMYMWGRKAPGGRVLVGAGARYFYDNGLRHRGDGFLFPAMHRVMAREFPPLAPFPFEHAWTGPMGCTVDQEPILGRTGEDGNIFYGGAYSGHGLAMGTRMGEFLAGAVDGAAVPAWLGRDLTPVPPEPLRYVGVNMTINLMNLGLYSMAKHER